MEGKIGTQRILSTAELAKLQLPPVAEMIAMIEERRKKGQREIHPDGVLSMLSGVAAYVARRREDRDGYHPPLSLAIRTIVAEARQTVTLNRGNMPRELYADLEPWQRARAVNNGGWTMDAFGRDVNNR